MLYLQIKISIHQCIYFKYVIYISYLIISIFNFIFKLKEGDKCDQEFNSKEIRYIIPFKCKIFSSTLRLPLLRFGDRLLLSQPIADIKNLYLLCACVNKNGQIIGPILHKDQDLFRKNLKTHESGLVSYELRTEKEFRSERDKLSSFGPIIRTRNGLPFDRDSPAGTDPVFFWILEKHSDKVWGSTQMFVVGCKKSTFFKDYMSPSSEQMIKRRMIPLPLISIDNMLPTNLLTECKRKKRSSITGTTLNMHPPNKITKISDSSSNFMYNEPYSQSSYSEGVSSNYSNDYQYCEQNFIQPNYSNFLAQQQFYPEIRDSFANDILYGLSPFDDYMMAG